ncbi:hypothetical protein CsatA_009845 [Cannabis sativa]
MNPFIESVYPGFVGKSVDSLMKVEQVEWDGEVLADLLTARDRALLRGQIKIKDPKKQKSMKDMGHVSQTVDSSTGGNNKANQSRRTSLGTVIHYFGFKHLSMGLCVTKVGAFLEPKTDGDDSDHNAEFADSNVIIINTKESWDQKLEEAKRDGKIVIANFSANWCGPCKMIAPFYCELSEKYPSLMFVVIDVDEMTDFSSSWDIKATPTFFFLRDGEQIDKLVGANKPELQKKIIALLDSTACDEK